MGVLSRSKLIWELHGIQRVTSKMPWVLDSKWGLPDTEANKTHRCIKPSPWVKTSAYEAILKCCKEAILTCCQEAILTFLHCPSQSSAQLVIKASSSHTRFLRRNTTFSLFCPRDWSQNLRTGWDHQALLVQCLYKRTTEVATPSLGGTSCWLAWRHTRLCVHLLGSSVF